MFNVLDFGAKGTGRVDDSDAIQAAINAAIPVNGTVFLPRGSYSISKPLIVANWEDGVYKQVCIKILGEDTMWSTMVTRIIANFKDGPALGLHLNKGTIIQGIYFEGLYKVPKLTPREYMNSNLDTYGDTTCRDTQFSPYCGVGIDIFRYNLPPDGGFPTLREWYRGPVTKSGSTGCRIMDCTFRGFTIGIIVSPNGYTLNAELMTFENIRVNNCKIAFVGCQSQEKVNRIINWGVWGTVRCAFVWNKYGLKQPGFYQIRDVNIADNVAEVLYRASSGWFPLHIDGLFAESINTFGKWSSTVGCSMRNSIVNYAHFTNTKALPQNHIGGSGVSYYNCNFRYYGDLTFPLLQAGTNLYFAEPQNGYANPIKGTYYQSNDVDYKKGWDAEYLGQFTLNTYEDNGIRKFTVIPVGAVPVNQGDSVFITQLGNGGYIGQAFVETIGPKSYTMAYIPDTIAQGQVVRIHKYIKK